MFTAQFEVIKGNKTVTIPRIKSGMRGASVPGGGWRDKLTSMIRLTENMLQFIHLTNI